MKTPREILLGRHKDAEPKLDAIRESTVAAMYDRRSSSRRAPTILHTIWRELILPSRLIWTGLATAWVLIFAANFFMRDHPQAPIAKTSASPDMILTYKQQEQLLTELIGPMDPPAAEPQKAYVPRPASLRSFGMMTA